jgi:hypothetical protein
MNKVKVNRRGVLKAGLGAAAVASTVGLSGCATSGGMAGSSSKKLGRVVVVGGVVPQQQNISICGVRVPLKSP